VVDLGRLLEGAGHQVSVLSTASPANLLTSGYFAPLTVSHESRVALPWPRRAEVAARAIWNPSVARLAACAIQAFEPDIVHCHKLYPQLSVAPVVVGSRRQVPVVQTLHDYEFISPDPTRIGGESQVGAREPFAFRALNLMTYRVRRAVHVPRVDKWVAVSRSVAAAHAVHGIEAAVIPNCVPGTPIARLPFEERAGVAYVGRLVPEKGVLDVVRLATELPEIPVFIAGRGPLAQAVSEAASALPNLTYYGHLDGGEIERLLGRVRVALMPSRWDEPGPLVALEAMRSGTPIVTTPRGGLAEYVGDAEAGFVVLHEDLIEAVRSIHTRSETFHRFSLAGLRAMRTTHSPIAFLASIEAVYRGVLGVSE
jgi:glycosyltransferase involved in cell wall biosynthesis